MNSIHIFRKYYPKSRFWKVLRKVLMHKHCLLAMVERWHKTLDEGGNTGGDLTDLFKDTVKVFGDFRNKQQKFMK